MFLCPLKQRRQNSRIIASGTHLLRRRNVFSVKVMSRTNPDQCLPISVYCLTKIESN